MIAACGPESLAQSPGVIEPFGNPTQVLAQERLFADRVRIAADPFLLHHGRTLIVKNGDVRPYADLIALVSRYRRILIYAQPPTLSTLVARLRNEGLLVEPELDLIGGSASLVLARLYRVQAKISLPQGWMFTDVTRDSPGHLIASIQMLENSCGLAPFPGWYLRGGSSGVRTIALQDPQGSVLGSAVSFDLGRVSSYPSAHVGMVASICLHARVRGQGLSVLLNVIALARAIEEFHCHHLCEIVERRNAASFAMNAKSGLIERLPNRVIFVEAAAEFSDIPEGQNE